MTFSSSDLKPWPPPWAGWAPWARAGAPAESASAATVAAMKLRMFEGPLSWKECPVHRPERVPEEGRAAGGFLDPTIRPPTLPPQVATDRDIPEGTHHAGEAEE